MSRVKRRISKTYLSALAIILVASLVASAVIGKKFGLNFDLEPYSIFPSSLIPFLLFF